MKIKFHPNTFWYVLPMFAVSVDNKYIAIGWLCVSLWIHLEATNAH